MNEKRTGFEKIYAQQVYDQMMGFSVDHPVPNVKDESDDGFVGREYDAFYRALNDLAGRFGFSGEDRNVLRMVEAMERLLRETGVKMFEYGARWMEDSREEN